MTTLLLLLVACVPVDSASAGSRPCHVRPELPNDGIDQDCDGVDLLDADLDGWVAAQDCDEADPLVYPGAPEVCDGLDDDCDGTADEGLPAASFYADADGDGWGASEVVTTACAAPPGLIADGSDCDDADPMIHPGATELCDAVDQDCDGELDEDLDRTEWAPDADGDGYGNEADATLSCGAPAGMVDDATDCDDTDPDVHPGAAEVCDDRDQDCDGRDDEGLATHPSFVDDDGDGYGRTSGGHADRCYTPDGYSELDGDCDDGDPDLHPAAPEVCDGLDDDCDGLVPDDEVDGDGDLRAVCAGDCDDADPDVAAGNLERCDGDDDDCDGVVDEDCVTCDVIVPDDVDNVAGGLAAVPDGGTVCVAPGDWPASLDFQGRAVTLRGLGGYAGTILDGGDTETVLTMTSGEGPDSVVEDLGIGHGAPSTGSAGGGARLEDASPTFVRVLFRDCTYDAYEGGAVYVSGGAPTFTDVAFQSNSVVRPDTDGYVTGSGGAMYLEDADVMLENVSFDHNAAAWAGAAIYQDGGTLTLRGASFHADTLTYYDGAALYVREGSVDAENAWFDHESAGLGAAIHADTDSTVALTHVLFTANVGYLAGRAAVAVYGDVTVDDGIVSGSQGAAFAVYGGSLDVRHTDVWDNSDGDYVGVPDPTGTGGNTAVDPLLLDALGHLDAASPLVDAGDPALVDPDGSPSDPGLHGGSGASLLDLDHDGWPDWWLPGPWDPGSSTDCDDSDATVYPGAGC